MGGAAGAEEVLDHPDDAGALAIGTPRRSACLWDWRTSRRGGATAARLPRVPETPALIPALVALASAVLAGALLHRRLTRLTHRLPDEAERDLPS